MLGNLYAQQNLTKQTCGHRENPPAYALTTREARWWFQNDILVWRNLRAFKLNMLIIKVL